jgi:hypothetical protein
MTSLNQFFYTSKIYLMKANFKKLAAILALSATIFSCQKEKNTTPTTNNGVSQDVVNQILAQGFSADNARKVDGGYVVEGDIYLSEEALKQPNIGPVLRVADEEQYHTTNLITGLPRTITVSCTGLSNIFVVATDTAVARYNALNLRIKFQRVVSGANVRIVGADLGGGGILGQSAGFPTAAGNPPSPITLNSHPGAFGSNPTVQFLGSIIAHEIGHTIGFRHTDFKNRAFSCGGIRVNEGQAGVGAILIPGTPSKPNADPTSWMLACIGLNENRPFNANDMVALNFLYK